MEVTIIASIFIVAGSRFIIPISFGALGGTANVAAHDGTKGMTVRHARRAHPFAFGTFIRRGECLRFPVVVTATTATALGTLGALGLGTLGRLGTTLSFSTLRTGAALSTLARTALGTGTALSALGTRTTL